MDQQPTARSVIGALKTQMRAVYKIRIIYKSGATIDFECFKFEIQRNGSGLRYTWNSADEKVFPVQIGVDDIAAVWQVGHREIEVAVD